MKFKVTFKDPDYIIHDRQWVGMGEDVIKRTLQEFLVEGEYITIEIDTETGAARVCKGY